MWKKTKRNKNHYNTLENYENMHRIRFLLLFNVGNWNWNFAVIIYDEWQKKKRWRRQKSEKQCSHFFVISLFFILLCFHQFCCFACIIIISLPLKKINNNELRMSTYIIQKKRTKFNSQNMNEWILYVLVVRTLAYKSFSGSNFFLFLHLFFIHFFPKWFCIHDFPAYYLLLPQLITQQTEKKLYIQQFFFQKNSKRILRWWWHISSHWHTHTHTHNFNCHQYKNKIADKRRDERKFKSESQVSIVFSNIEF